MAVDDFIIELTELPVAAVLALDTGLVANTLNPLIVAGNRIPAFSLLALPAVSKNISAATKQTSEKCNFFRHRERLRCWWRRGLPELLPELLPERQKIAFFLFYLSQSGINSRNA